MKLNEIKLTDVQQAAEFFDLHEALEDAPLSALLEALEEELQAGELEKL